MAAAAGFVTVAPDSTGKSVGNFAVTLPVGTLVTDGSGNVTALAAATTVFLQRVVVSDTDGTPITKFANDDRQEEILKELREMRHLMCEYYGAIYVESDNLRR